MKTTITENELNFLLKEANIGSIDEVSDKIQEMKHQEYLQLHKYKITPLTDGRFSTYLPDDTKPNHRRKIVKPTQKLLEQEIIKFYKEKQQKEQKQNKCLKDFYPEWLEYKSLHTDSSAYIKTIDELWYRYYENDSISLIPIVELTYYMLDKWAHSLVKAHNMTKKQYYNMAIIMRQALQLAVTQDIIEDSPFDRVKVNRKLFKKTQKKNSETQVYLIDEQPLIEQEAYADFERTRNTACLAIPLAFQTGLRISELVGLKFSDINEEKENCIHIQRMEVVTYTQQADGTWSSPKREITERTKSLSGKRNVYLTTLAREIISKIKKANWEMGYDNSGYIFMDKRGRITAKALDSRLRKYCRHINISEKGMHTIRKTYISTLIDSEEISINYIREQVGHVDERTTFGNYCFNRKPKDQTAINMEKALVH